MKDNNDVVLVTSWLPADRSSARTPLTRLILPLSVMQGGIFFPYGSVWWVESQNARYWLRGLGQVSGARVQETLNTNTFQLTWDLSPNLTERLTQPSKGAPRIADVSDLLAEVLPHRRGIQLIPISRELDIELHERRQHLGETTGIFAVAQRHVFRLMEQSRLNSQLPNVNRDLSAAWQFARAHFARSELISIPGWDSFQVAAVVLAGLTQMPETWQLDAKQNLNEMVMCFDDLDIDNIARVKQGWSSPSAHPLSLDALEQSDKRHQLILKSLASNLRQHGFKPTYNRFVDLRVVLQTREHFFEIKTAHQENFLHQVRLAAGQLLEYRFRSQKQNGDPSLGLIAVVEHDATEQDLVFARQFLESLNISLVLWDAATDSFDQLYSTLLSRSA